jgi:hypothetical protein
MIETSMKYFSITVALIAVLIFIFAKETESWSGELEGANGRVNVEFSESRDRYFEPINHVISWGGGNKENRLNITFSNQTTLWESKGEKPLLIDWEANTFYLISFSNDKNYVGYNFYECLKGESWKPVKFQNIPCHLLVKNFKMIDDLDPRTKEFYSSHTARLWFCYLKGMSYQESLGKLDRETIYDFIKACPRIRHRLASGVLVSGTGAN